jgi:oligoribonuclease NrnB/cAMP/cGMP phosphodiesterase (DHH superfamily)
MAKMVHTINAGEQAEPSLRHWHLFTHAGCMDGSACAILFMHAGGKKENIHYVIAGRLDQAIADERVVKSTAANLLIVDVAPTTDAAAQYLVERGNFVVIDHHKSSERFAGKPGFHIDIKNEACGCENLRRWLVANDEFHLDSEPWKRFCRIVDDHDRWQRLIPWALELPRFLSFVGQKDFVERFMDVPRRFATEQDSYWTPFESDVMALVKRRQDINFRNLMQKFQFKQLQRQGRSIKIAYVITDEINNSELLMSALDSFGDVDVACQISFGLQKVAFRSRSGGVDVSEFAREHGGGGHAAASSHPLPHGLIAQIIGGMHHGT